MRNAIAAALALSCAVAFAKKQAPKPLEFKGMVIGSVTTPEEITDQFRIYCGPKVAAGIYCWGLGTIGDASGNMAINLGPSMTVDRILVTFDSESFEGVFLALVEKHGRPGRLVEPVVQNRMGAKYKSIEAGWTKPGRTYISAVKYAGSLDTASVEFGVIGSQSKERDSIKRKAKDL